ncbi:MAG TPA: RES family NAD+ phosphorylase [Solirubrobacter sp.]|nr:RES family NAD+ phosphorylase [Solirubrobacter sp.]
MTLDVVPVAVTGVWWRHVPSGGDPAFRRDPPASGRWQRGDVVAALYLAGDPETCWAEWYRRLAEDGVEPLDALPRDLWRYEVMLERVAVLDSVESLRRVGLAAPSPTRTEWPAFQAVGAQLWAEGYSGVLCASAARPNGRTLCVFRPGGALPGSSPLPPPERRSEPPTPPRGLRT